MTRGGMLWVVSNKLMLAFPIYTVRCNRSHSKILVKTKLNSLSLLGSALPCSSVFCLFQNFFFFFWVNCLYQFLITCYIEAIKFQPNSHLDHMKGLNFFAFILLLFLFGFKFSSVTPSKKKTSFPLSQRGKVCHNLGIKF